MEVHQSFRIMIDPKGEIPKNIFVTDRFFVRDARPPPPPPPKHFRYEIDDRDLVCYYTIVEDENDPPPPASLLRLSEMTLEQLRRVAFGNGLRGWETLNKDELVKFLVAHRYIFSDDFYKQRSLPNQLQAWVDSFAVGDFAKHYAEVMTNSLIRTSYLGEFVSCERKWWWDRDCLHFAFCHEIELFMFGMESFMLFDKLICFWFEMIVYALERFLNVDESHGSYNVWRQEVGLEWEAMRGKLDDVVWCFEDRVKFVMDLRNRLQEKISNMF